MTLQKRRKILFFLIFLFFVLGGGITLYAQGWRVSPIDFAVQKVGGIFIKTYPPRANIFLDNKSIPKNTWFFQNGKLINNLFPETYVVRLELPDYEPWKQTVTVKPSFVTELKYAILLPKTRTEMPESGTVSDVFTADGELILKNASGTLSLSGKTVPGTTINSLTNQDRKIFSYDANRKLYFFYDVRQGTSVNVSQFLRNAGLDEKQFVKITPDQEEIDTLLLLGKTQIYSADLRNNQLNSIYRTSTATSSKNIVLGKDIAASPTHIVWSEYDKASGTSHLVLYEKSTRNIYRSQVGFPGETLKLAWSKNTFIGVLQNDGGFYYGDAFSNQIPKLASDGKDFLFEKNGDRVVVLEHEAIEIFPFKDLAVEKYARFALPENSQIQKLMWYKDSRHLFVHYPERVMFLDIDDSLLEHYYLLSPSPKTAYNADKNQFYYIKDNSLYRLDLPE